MTIRGIREHEDITLGRVLAELAKLDRRVTTCINLCTDTNTRVSRLEERLDARAHRPYSESDAGEITGVESLDQMADMARKQRARAALKELEAKESEAKAHRSRLTAQIATGVAIVAGILQGLQLAGVFK